MIHREFLRRGTIRVLAAILLLVGSRTQAADPASSVTVLIAYHSVSGNTEKMAQGVAEGAKAVSGTKVIVKRVGDVATDDLLSSDAVIVGMFPVLHDEVKQDADLTRRFGGRG